MLKTKSMNWKIKTQVPRSNLQVRSQNIFLGYEKKKGIVENVCNCYV